MAQGAGSRPDGIPAAVDALRAALGAGRGWVATPAVRLRPEKRPEG